MSSKFLKPFNKVMGAIGIVDEEDEIIENEDEQEKEEEYQEPEIISSRRNKLVSIKTTTVPRVLLKRPGEFQDIMEIVDAVKSRKIVVMNISEVDQRLAQRMIDCIVGACYALNGSFQEIAKSIYLVAPDNVEISNELKQELNKNGFFSFSDK